MARVEKDACGAFIDRRGGGYMQKPQSALIVIFKLVISGLTSIIFTVLGTVNLHLRGPFVLISLWPILGIVAGIVLGTAWSSCS